MVSLSLSWCSSRAFSGPFIADYSFDQILWSPIWQYDFPNLVQNVWVDVSFPIPAISKYSSSAYLTTKSVYFRFSWLGSTVFGERVGIRNFTITALNSTPSVPPSVSVEYTVESVDYQSDSNNRLFWDFPASSVVMSSICTASGRYSFLFGYASNILTTDYLYLPVGGTVSFKLIWCSTSDSWSGPLVLQTSVDKGKNWTNILSHSSSLNSLWIEQLSVNIPQTSYSANLLLRWVWLGSTTFGGALALDDIYVCRLVESFKTLSRYLEMTQFKNQLFLFLN